MVTSQVDRYQNNRGLLNEEEKIMELERIRKEIRSNKAANFGLSSPPPHLAVRLSVRDATPLMGVKRMGGIPSLDIVDYDSEDVKNGSYERDGRSVEGETSVIDSS